MGMAYSYRLRKCSQIKSFRPSYKKYLLKRRVLSLRLKVAVATEILTHKGENSRHEDRRMRKTSFQSPHI